MRAEVLLSSRSVGRHRWLVSLDPAAPPTMRSRIESVARDFGDALARGAFCLSHGGRPSCTYVEKPTGKDFAWEYDLSGCDVRYARVLRNALYAVEQLTQSPISIKAAQAPPTTELLSLTVDANAVEEGTFYPAQLLDLPFSFETRDTDRADRHRRLLLEYPRPIDDAIEAEVADDVSLWGRCVCFGYPPSEERFVEGQFGVLDIQSAVFDELTYEILAEIFDAPEAAWAPLLNLLAHMPPAGRCRRAILE